VKSWRTTGALIALSFCAFPCCLAFADNSILQHVDQDAESSILVSDFLDSHLVERYSLVIIDVQKLHKTIAEFNQPDRDKTCCILDFLVLPDIEIALHTYQVESERLKPWHWTGIDSLSGNESVIALLIINVGDRVTGSFDGLGNRIRIEPLDRSGTHIIWESKSIKQRID